MMFTHAGYEVLTAHTVPEGIACAAANSVDLVLLDYSLCAHNHHCNGCIADQIHRISPRAKIVAWCADDSIHRDHPPCAELALIKPVPAPELVARVNALLQADLSPG
jgi:DNA-binding response OmpR family regulator